MSDDAGYADELFEQAMRCHRRWRLDKMGDTLDGVDRNILKNFERLNGDGDVSWEPSCTAARSGPSLFQRQPAEIQVAVVVATPVLLWALSYVVRFAAWVL